MYMEEQDNMLTWEDNHGEVSDTVDEVEINVTEPLRF